MAFYLLKRGATRLRRLLPERVVTDDVGLYSFESYKHVEPSRARGNRVGISHRWSEASDLIKVIRENRRHLMDCTVERDRFTCVYYVSCHGCSTRAYVATGCRAAWLPQ